MTVNKSLYGMNLFRVVVLLAFYFSVPFICQTRFASVDESTDWDDLARDNPWLKNEVRSVEKRSHFLTMNGIGRKGSQLDKNVHHF